MGRKPSLYCRKKNIDPKEDLPSGPLLPTWIPRVRLNSLNFDHVNGLFSFVPLRQLQIPHPGLLLKS